MHIYTLTHKIVLKYYLHYTYLVSFTFFSNEQNLTIEWGKGGDSSSQGTCIKDPWTKITGWGGGRVECGRWGVNRARESNGGNGDNCNWTIKNFKKEKICLSNLKTFCLPYYILFIPDFFTLAVYHIYSSWSSFFLSIIRPYPFMLGNLFLLHVWNTCCCSLFYRPLCWDKWMMTYSRDY